VFVEVAAVEVVAEVEYNLVLIWHFNILFQFLLLLKIKGDTGIGVIWQANLFFLVISILLCNRPRPFHFLGWNPSVTFYNTLQKA